MRNLIVLFMMLMLVVGCRSKTNIKNKDIYKATVENVVQVEAQVTKEIKKDSVVKVKEKVQQVDTSTKVKIDFDPKKHDSLDVKYGNGNDSLRVTIKGNGVVSIEYEKNTKEENTEKNTIFGSQTLFKMDSTLNNKSKQIINTKAVQQKRNVKSTGFDAGTYILIGICLVVLLTLLFLWDRFGGKIVDKFNNWKNNRHE